MFQLREPLTFANSLEVCCHKQYVLEPVAAEKAALLRDGDIVNVDVEKRSLNVELSEAELAARKAAWRAPAPRYTHGVFAKYAKLVTSASKGAVCVV